MFSIGAALWLFSTEAPAAPPASPPPVKTIATPDVVTDDASFGKLVESLVDQYANFYPTEATSLGLHGHDGDLEDLSAAARAQELSWLRIWQRKLGEVPEAKLSSASRFDLALLRHAVAERMFARGEVRDERRRPAVYLRLLASSINVLIKRDFAPLEARLASVMSRQAKIPGLLSQAETNLDQMAQVSIDVTLSDLDATTKFFTDDVPQAFASIKDEKKKAALGRSCREVASSLKKFGEFLRQSRPQANAPYALGPEMFRKRLWAEEMIDEPLPSLLNRAQAELARLQNEFKKTAQKIDAQKPAAMIQTELQKDHPSPDKIISETTARLATQQKFLVDKNLITLPSSQLPAVKETPPFMRATSLASMDTAGPFETSRAAYYYVTLPESNWKAEQTEDFLRGAYSRTLIDVVNIHEAFPGHYVQGLWLSKLSNARKVFGTGSNTEGWAHYSEQMMLDENYGGGDPKLRLAQLQDALLRSARFVVALRMHTMPPGQAMTVEQATEFFNRDGMQTRKVSEMEALRGTQDPMYLVYTYGKLEIYKLRQEVQAQRGRKFTLRQFHDELLSYGRAPLKMVRQAMLAQR